MCIYREKFRIDSNPKQLNYVTVELKKATFSLETIATIAVATGQRHLFNLLKL